MLRHILGVDHTVIMVADLDAAQRTYERLGFTLSPRARHSAHMGTANHTIMLGRDYFELLGVLAPTEQNANWRRRLAEREGLHGIALATDDAEKAQAELKGSGIAASEAVRFSRPVDLPKGGTKEAAFVVTKLPEEATPGGVLFVCGHLTRDVVWLPELQRHANGAMALAEVVMAHKDLDAVAAAYGRIFGRETVTRVADRVTVATGTIPLTVLAPGAVPGRYPGVAMGKVPEIGIVGMAVSVGDLAQTGQCLAKGGFKPAAVPGRLTVPPSAACGVAFEFRG
ncbi:MAG: VOC family protein [Alphaproteobacteria bacterium]|nr:VOC family protein [Alphaproteobacteria bacterium]